MFGVWCSTPFEEEATVLGGEMPALPAYDSLMPTVLRLAPLMLRWWFGTTYFVAGVGGVIASPVMLARGNYGGIYMFIGGITIAGLGYVIHPWGWKRRNAGHGLTAHR
jgi:hypothetical protein